MPVVSLEKFPLNCKPHDFFEDAAVMAGWLTVLHGDSPTVELRALGCVESNYRKPHTRSGIYDPAHFPEMAKRALALSRDVSPGVYFTLNPVHPDLLSRRNNREDVSERGETVSDDNITGRRLLLIDLDPKRIAGVSSTDEEKALALALAEKIRDDLKSAGWPDPIFADSGNGYHLLYRIDLPTDDGGIVERCLKALDAKDSTEAVSVDTSVFNSSRIVKLYGTIGRKGDNTEQRPWRRSKILTIPDGFNSNPVPPLLLATLAAQAPAATCKPASVIPHKSFGPASAKELARIRKYMASVPGAVSGDDGHDNTIKAANVLVWKAALTIPEALPTFQEWNQTCQPPWDEQELIRKLDEALKKPHGIYGELRQGKGKRSTPARRKAGAKPAQADGGNAELTEAELDKAAGELAQMAQMVGSVLHDDDEICNAVVTKTEDEKIVEPLPMREIIRRAKAKTGNWPRRMGGVLFVHESANEIGFIEKAPALFGYLGENSGKPPQFVNNSECHTKPEVFEEFKRQATAYEAIEQFPHEPVMPGHYYSCEMPHAGDGDCLRELLSRFNPATEIDRDLILALFATLIWGGRGGTRPAFCITSDDGRGAGKTTVVNVAGYLVGAALEIIAGEDAARVKTRLLSPEGLLKRVVLLDNAKARCLSWADLEGMITAPAISGHRLFTGEMARPNVITWCVTMNGGSYSTDLAQRSVFIKVAKPTYKGNWEESIREFIDANRQAIFGDLIGFLRGQQTELKRHTRWGAWERDILSRLPEPNDAQAVILERQNAADAEVEESEVIRDYFRAQIEAAGYLTNFVRVFIPSNIARLWLSNATGEKYTTIGASRALSQFVNEGKLVNVELSKSRAAGRGFIWLGDNWNPDDPIRDDLEAKGNATNWRHSDG
jgi:hypothetical protein